MLAKAFKVALGFTMKGIAALPGTRPTYYTYYRERGLSGSYLILLR